MCIVAIRAGRHIPALYKTERPKTCEIEGRTCNQRDTYTIRVGRTKNVKGHKDGTYICRRLQRADELHEHGTVYNISVEDDESYIANGAIVHNCQDISVAGKQLGFQGNRSSLFFRVMYLLGQQSEEERPHTLFIENVKNLLSVNGGWDFARLLAEMDRGGYDAEWQILNSKDFGVPQNRERCFIVGHLRGRSRRDIFPLGSYDTEAVELQGLEDSSRVLSNTLTARITADCGGTYPIIEGGGYSTESERPALYGISAALSDKIDIRKQDIAHAILSRDYKGFKNLVRQTGVMYETDDDNSRE